MHQNWSSLQMEEKKLIYTNFTRVSFSPFDFIMEFGLNYPEVTPQDVNKDMSETEIKHVELFRLIMSPEHFKAFLNAANSQFEVFQERLQKETK